MMRRILLIGLMMAQCCYAQVTTSPGVSGVAGTGVVNNGTFNGTAGQTYTFPTTSAIIARTDAANTFTGTQTIGGAVVTTLNGHTFTAGSSTFTGTAAATYTFPSVTATLAKLAGNTFTGGQNYALAAGSTDSGASLYTIYLNAGTRTTTATLMRISGAVSTDSYFGGPINADAIAWGAVGGAENGRITTATGNMSLGSATDDGVNKLQVTGGIKGSGTLLLPGLSTSSAATTGTLCWTTSTGNVNVDTTTTCLLSARKYKKDIVDLHGALDEVMLLRPVSYQLRDEVNPEHLGRQVGFIADEVQKVDDRFVSVDENGDAHSVRYQQMVALIVKGMQEQQKQIRKLQREIKRFTAVRLPRTSP